MDHPHPQEIDMNRDQKPKSTPRKDARPRAPTTIIFSGKALRELCDDHRDLMRAAHAFCVSELTIADMHYDRKIKSQLDDDPEWQKLWALCKDYDPTND